jgi:SOS1/NGEF-like PH domain
LISATRRLWHEGSVQEWSKNRKLKDRYLFLFNDLLLVTQRKSGEKKYRLRTKILLASCSVDDRRDFSPTMFTAEARACS